MPVLDMPLEKLLTYQGVNDCPADLDEFWDRGIAEMEALGTGCELELKLVNTQAIAKLFRYGDNLMLTSKDADKDNPLFTLVVED